MSIKLTQQQVHTLGLIRRGVNTAPPLRQSVLDALLRKRMIEEYRYDGVVRYRETAEGKRFA